MDGGMLWAIRRAGSSHVEGQSSMAVGLECLPLLCHAYRPSSLMHRCLAAPTRARPLHLHLLPQGVDQRSPYRSITAKRYR